MDYFAARVSRKLTTAKSFAKPAKPRPFPRLAPLSGNFVNPSLGEAAVKEDGDVLVMELRATSGRPSGQRLL
jgi:hypothetical protein